LKNEKYGFISTDIVIETAKDIGRIGEIGNIVLCKICKFMKGKDFPKLGIESISVNLSVAECMKSGAAASIIKTINKYGVDKSKISFEITESVTGLKQKSILKNLNEFNKEGIEVIIDNYGTGYTNIGQMSSMPYEGVKMDIRNIKFKSDEGTKIVIENSIKMIKAMKKYAIVEGVEENEELKSVMDFGCDYVQGFCFSKPLKKKEFIKFMKEDNTVL